MGLLHRVTVSLGLVPPAPRTTDCRQPPSLLCLVVDVPVFVEVTVADRSTL